MSAGLIADSLRFQSKASPETLDFALLDELLRRNAFNKDLLVKFEMKQLPSELRRIILKRCFCNGVLQKDFLRAKRENQINSPHETHIVKVGAGTG